MGVDRSITGNIIANPLLWLLTRTASRGAQGVIWAATDSSLDRMTGKLFSSMQVRQGTNCFVSSLSQCCARLLFLTQIDFVIKISGD